MMCTVPLKYSPAPLHPVSQVCSDSETAREPVASEILLHLTWPLDLILNLGLKGPQVSKAELFVPEPEPGFSPQPFLRFFASTIEPLPLLCFWQCSLWGFSHPGVS